MPAFIKGEDCIVIASEVQEVHHSGNFGGIVGVKTAVANTTTHGNVVARLAEEGRSYNSMNDGSNVLNANAAKAAKVAETLAECILTYANATDKYVLSFDAEKQDWDATRVK